MGQRFYSATGEEIPNLGSLNAPMIVESGQPATMAFQAAKVRKPLLSVSRCNQKGNTVVFGGDESYILPTSAAELCAIRELIQKTPNKVKLHLKDGVFKLRTWKKPTTLFQGPGW